MVCLLINEPIVRLLVRIRNIGGIPGTCLHDMANDNRTQVLIFLLIVEWVAAGDSRRPPDRADYRLGVMQPGSEHGSTQGTRPSAWTPEQNDNTSAANRHSVAS